MYDVEILSYILKFLYSNQTFCFIDMLSSGIVQLAQKAATQFGDCLALVGFWKNSMITYHENKKVYTWFFSSKAT